MRARTDIYTPPVNSRHCMQIGGCLSALTAFYLKAALRNHLSIMVRCCLNIHVLSAAMNANTCNAARVLDNCSVMRYNIIYVSGKERLIFCRKLYYTLFQNCNSNFEMPRFVGRRLFIQSMQAFDLHSRRMRHITVYYFNQRVRRYPAETRKTAG